MCTRLTANCRQQKSEHSDEGEDPSETASVLLAMFTPKNKVSSLCFFVAGSWWISHASSQKAGCRIFWVISTIWLAFYCYYKMEFDPDHLRRGNLIPLGLRWLGSQGVLRE